MGFWVGVAKAVGEMKQEKNERERLEEARKFQRETILQGQDFQREMAGENRAFQREMAAASRAASQSAAATARQQRLEDNLAIALAQREAYKARAEYETVGPARNMLGRLGDIEDVDEDTQKLLNDPAALAKLNGIVKSIEDKYPGVNLTPEQILSNTVYTETENGFDVEFIPSDNLLADTARLQAEMELGMPEPSLSADFREFIPADQVTINAAEDYLDNSVLDMAKRFEPADSDLLGQAVSGGPGAEGAKFELRGKYALPALRNLAKNSAYLPAVKNTLLYDQATQGDPGLKQLVDVIVDPNTPDEVVQKSINIYNTELARRRNGT